MASKEMEGLKKIMVQMMDKGYSARFDGKIDPVQLRTIIEKAQAGMPIAKGVNFFREKFGEMDAELAMPEESRNDAVIIYIHGGGLVCGNASTSRGYSSLMAAETGIPTYAFSYRLAPENPYPAAADDCFLAYQEIQKKNPGKSLFLIGESAGAYLSVTTALRVRDAGLPMPKGVIPYSTLMDFSGKIARNRKENDDFTVTLAGMDVLWKMYCNSEQRRDPYVSNCYADFHGMPPMLMAWDRTETLAPDNELLTEKLTECGIEVNAKAYEGCFHAFATTGKGTPESAEVLQNTISFIEKHI